MWSNRQSQLHWELIFFGLLWKIRTGLYADKSQQLIKINGALCKHDIDADYS